jgi:hypothetical protein
VCSICKSNDAITDPESGEIFAARPNQTMQNCPRTYCQGDWSGYRAGWIEQIDVAGNGPCFPGMQQLILAKCISGVRLDSNDYKVGYGLEDMC